MLKFWQSKRFKILKEEWDEKLKTSGFEDAEKSVGGDLLLKVTSVCEKRFAGIYRFKTRAQIEEKAEYFRVIFQAYSNETNFDDESDKLIMLRTAEGFTIAEISIELKLLGKKKYNRDTIRYIRRRYEDKWGIKKWRKDQMVSRRAPTK